VWPKLASAAALLLTLVACGGAPAASSSPSAKPANPDVILATTTSTQDSGLLEVLVPRFEREGGWRVKTVSVGTGAALKLGSRGEADVVLVHAPKLEESWMAEGNGTARLLVMHNDFVLVGPSADPARVKSVSGILPALQQIAARRAPFVSRDDNSGTDVLEKGLWKDAGVVPRGMPWYLRSGQGMGATLTLADQKAAYALSDRATFLAQQGRLQLALVLQRDPALLNVYHVMPVNPRKFAHVNGEGGRAFAQFLVAPAIQKVIGSFGKEKFGESLFFPDAGKREDQVGRQ
jgi:tungstate transport system substrate-binding protein